MQTDVLIIGAGLCGLAVAKGLTDRNADWLLLEARDRVGGRILTRQSDRVAADAVPADMGPSWIWPGQPRVAGLLQSLDIGVFEQYSAGRLVYEDETGQVRRDLDYSTMAGSLRIDGGSARLVRDLAATLPVERLLCEHRVQRIRRGKAGYEVELQASGQPRSIRARKVVLALPPRLAAQSIEFEPALDTAIVSELNDIPTWMAGHAKVFVIYDKPFWRELGLSGDGISRRGPLMEIHDASAARPDNGALFGFVGLDSASSRRDPETLVPDCLQQLQRLFGDAAAEPLDVIVKDWYRDALTAVAADSTTRQHPHYGMPSGVRGLAETQLYFAGSEMAGQFGGFIEGALEAAEYTLAQI